MLQAMNTGHDGSMSTHPRQPAARGADPPREHGGDGRRQPAAASAIRTQIAAAVDLIVQISRMRDGMRRVTHITEIVGMEGDVITTQDLFTYRVSRAKTPDGRLQGPFQVSRAAPALHAARRVFRPRPGAAGGDRMRRAAAGSARSSPPAADVRLSSCSACCSRSATTTAAPAQARRSPRCDERLHDGRDRGAMLRAAPRRTATATLDRCAWRCVLPTAASMLRRAPGADRPQRSASAAMRSSAWSSRRSPAAGDHAVLLCRRCSPLPIGRRCRPRGCRIWSSAILAIRRARRTFTDLLPRGDRPDGPRHASRACRSPKSIADRRPRDARSGRRSSSARSCDQIAFGQPLEEALWDTARAHRRRRSSTSSSSRLSIQRETGGNLAETLENLSTDPAPAPADAAQDQGAVVGGEGERHDHRLAAVHDVRHLMLVNRRLCDARCSPTRAATCCSASASSCMTLGIVRHGQDGAVRDMNSARRLPARRAHDRRTSIIAMAALVGVPRRLRRLAGAAARGSDGDARAKRAGRAARPMRRDGIQDDAHAGQSAGAGRPCAAIVERLKPAARARRQRERRAAAAPGRLALARRAGRAILFAKLAPAVRCFGGIGAWSCSTWLQLYHLPPMIRPAVIVRRRAARLLRPDIFVKNAIDKRRTAIRKGLPDALDLLVICAEAGLSLDAALTRVAEELGACAAPSSPTSWASPRSSWASCRTAARRCRTWRSAPICRRSAAWSTR